MSDTVEHTAYGEVQRLWLANIPPSSYNLWAVGDVEKISLEELQGC